MNKERLLKVAEHLEHGKLGHQFFDFSTINRWRGSPSRCRGVGCGSHGCAMGELPIIFPNEWRFIGPGVVAKGQGYFGLDMMMEQISEFFDIHDSIVTALFYPRCPRPWTNIELPDTASKEEVAQGIRDFITWKEKGLE